jgi:protein O-mannosyl-transferase
LADSSPPHRESGSRRAVSRPPRPWFALCFVLIVVIGSYLPVLGAPFVWDDHHLIEDSPLIQELHPLRDYFRQAFWQADELGRGRAFYRPLTLLSLAIDHELYGDGSGGYHLSNLLVHLISTALLFRLLCVRGASGHAAAVGAALWSLHPRLTEAVAWVSGRTDLLATCFVLAALLAQARPGAARRFACAVLLFLGLLCKEVALAGVAAVLVLELMRSGSLPARAWRALPALLALGGYASLRVLASGVASVGSVPLGTRLFRAMAAAGQYFVMFLSPWLPNAQIGQLSKPHPAYAALGCAVVLGLGALLVRFRGRLTPAIWSALTLSAVGLGLVLHIVPFFSNVIAADRFLYLPLVGIALLLTPALATLANPNLLAVACGVLSLSFIGATFLRADAWADEVKLWTSTFRDNPDNQHVACAQLGRLYVRAGLPAQALSLYQGCNVAPGSRFILLSNGAAVLARAGRYREGLALLDTLGDNARNRTLVLVNQALFYTYLNDFGAARAALARALNADPQSRNALALSRQLPAIEQARKQLDALPSTAPALERARLLQDLGLSKEAMDAWQLAFASGLLSREQFLEGFELVLSQGDAATVEALHREYLAQFKQPVSASLELAYSARHDLSLSLLAVWPSLGLPLRALPSRTGS